MLTMNPFDGEAAGQERAGEDLSGEMSAADAPQELIRDVVREVLPEMIERQRRTRGQRQ
jgi:hypothetical protein